MEFGLCVVCCCGLSCRSYVYFVAFVCGNFTIKLSNHKQKYTEKIQNAFHLLIACSVFYFYFFVFYFPLTAIIRVFFISSASMHFLFSEKSRYIFILKANLRIEKQKQIKTFLKCSRIQRFIFHSFLRRLSFLFMFCICCFFFARSLFSVVVFCFFILLININKSVWPRPIPLHRMCSQFHE